MSVEARCRGSIDYTKPIKPFIEELILERLETSLLLSTGALAKIDNGFSSVFPWVEVKEQKSSADKLKDRVAQWRAVYGDENKK